MKSAPSDGELLRLGHPWRIFLTIIFDFFRFYFPKIHELIDFGQQCRFLDKELAKIVPASATGKRHVDKLIEVHWKRGGNDLILLHVEVQAQPDSRFAERMFDYNCRIRQRYRRPVSSMALLVDERPKFRPDRYFEDAISSSIEFKYEVVKLLDFKTEEELLADPSPFAIVSLVQLRKLQAGRRVEQRFDYKVALMRELYRRNYSPEDVQKLFWFLDSVLTLPEDLTGQFRNEVEKIEEELTMPYMSVYERNAMEKGVRQGIVNTVRQTIEVRFGDVPESLLESMQQCESVEQLQEFHKRALTVEALDELQF